MSDAPRTSPAKQKSALRWRDVVFTRMRKFDGEDTGMPGDSPSVSAVKEQRK
jgi:hypothetical protein